MLRRINGSQHWENFRTNSARTNLCPAMEASPQPRTLQRLETTSLIFAQQSRKRRRTANLAMRLWMRFSWNLSRNMENGDGPRVSRARTFFRLPRNWRAPSEFQKTQRKIRSTRGSGIDFPTPSSILRNLLNGPIG